MPRQDTIDELRHPPQRFEQISATTLPESVAELADEYDDVAGERDRYLWQSIYSLFPSFTLSSVPPKFAATART
ncbi:hypothetical protein [Haladaptatus sp. NG-WS-4]